MGDAAGAAAKESTRCDNYHSLRWFQPYWLGLAAKAHCSCRAAHRAQRWVHNGLETAVLAMTCQGNGLCMCHHPVLHIMVGCCVQCTSKEVKWSSSCVLCSCRRAVAIFGRFLTALWCVVSRLMRLPHSFMRRSAHDMFCCTAAVWRLLSSAWHVADAQQHLATLNPWWSSSNSYLQHYGTCWHPAAAQHLPCRHSCSDCDKCRPLPGGAASSGCGMHLTLLAKFVGPHYCRLC